MFTRLQKAVTEFGCLFMPSRDADLSNPIARRLSRAHFLLGDQGVLRLWWTNFYPVADRAFRSNQPSPKRLKTYQRQGIRSVLNLRGVGTSSNYLFEKEACEKLGLCLKSVHLKPKSLPTLETLKTLEAHFHDIPKPFVMHCKSGADRAGFAAALYLLLIEGAPVNEAARQLSFKYLHIKASKKGIFDYCLETYRKTNEAAPIAFRDWMMTEYDPVKIEAGFKLQRSSRRAG